MKLLTIATLTLSACVHGLPPGSRDAAIVVDAERDWAHAGLPGPGDCLEYVEIRRASNTSRYVDECDGGMPDAYGAAARNSAGCLTSELRGVLGHARFWVVNLAPGYGSDAQLVIHELRHAMIMCHLDRSPADPFDAQHSDPRVWR